MRIPIATIVIISCFAPTLVLGEDNKEQYLPCNTGPVMLRQVDAWEKDGVVPDIKERGKRISPEVLSERLIADCSQHLSVLSAAAESNEDSEFRGLAAAWKNNLEFMKWWLQNRRIKIQSPKTKTLPNK